MAIAYIQEFAIRDGKTSTANYDAVVAALDLQDAPDGLIVHTAGFDLDAGVFRIFDVWESRAQGQRFMDERLNPVIEPMMAGRERRFRAPHARRLVRAARRASRKLNWKARSWSAPRSERERIPARRPVGTH